MITASFLRLLLLLPLCFLSAAHAVAASRVLVTVPELHSLVSDLMKGAGEPELLLDNSVRRDSGLTSAQVRSVISADVIVWSGPGLEAPLKKALDETVPAAAINLVTLSNYVPLLNKTGATPGVQSGLHDRQASRDLRFWSDPRLAIKAVRYITPRLVRLDPDHQELYLDNEIKLVKRLKKLEGDITAMLAPFGVLSADVFPASDRYFAHRFQANSVAQRDIPKPEDQLAGEFCTVSGFQKVSLETESAPANGGQSEQTDLSLYFQSMREKARAALDTLCVHPSARSAGIMKNAAANGI